MRGVEGGDVRGCLKGWMFEGRRSKNPGQPLQVLLQGEGEGGRGEVGGILS